MNSFSIDQYLNLIHRVDEGCHLIVKPLSEMPGEDLVMFYSIYKCKVILDAERALDRTITTSEAEDKFIELRGLVKGYLGYSMVKNAQEITLADKQMRALIIATDWRKEFLEVLINLCYALKGREIDMALIVIAEFIYVSYSQYIQGTITELEVRVANYVKEYI